MGDCACDGGLQVSALIRRALMAAAKKRAGGGVVYATWNAADKHAAYSLSNNDLTITRSGASGNTSARATLPKSSGKWYVEITASSAPASSDDGQIGFADAAAPVINTYLGGAADSALITEFTSVYASSRFSAGVTPGNLRISSGGIINVAIDLDSGKIWCGKNGTWYGDPVAGTSPALTMAAGMSVCIAARLFANGVSQTWNFGASAFSYSPPAGFNAGWYEE